MTITELIKHLQELQRDHGDCWVEDSKGASLDIGNVRALPDDSVIVFHDAVLDMWMPGRVMV